MTNIPPPILSNPPAFLLLTLVFAIAAYLRQVSENATKLRNEIRNGNWSAVFPLDAAHTKEKMRLLQKTRNKLAQGARWIIGLAILIALRCLAHAIIVLCVAYGTETVGWVDIGLRWVDVGVTSSLSITLIILGVMHQVNQMEDAFVHRLEELKQASPGEVLPAEQPIVG